MATIHTSFENPLTGTTYRLVDEGLCWRITRSAMDNGRCRLLHLRVRPGHDPFDPEALAAFAAGESREGLLHSNETAVFTHVVLHDLRFTMRAYAQRLERAEEMATHGRAGFRPGSPLLRQQREEQQERCSLAAAMLAGAWRSTELQPPPEGLPEWLALALDDDATTAEPTTSAQVSPKAWSAAMR